MLFGEMDKGGITAIGDLVGWFTYLKSGEPFSEYRGNYPNFPQSAEEIHDVLTMFGRGHELDDFKDMLVEGSLEPQNLINAISAMTPVQFMDFYEDTRFNPALAAMADNNPEGFYTAIKGGNTPQIEAAITPHMDRLKDGLKEMNLVDLLTLLPGLGESRGMDEAFSELFRAVVESNDSLAGALVEFAVASVVEVSSDFAELMEAHGDPESAAAWRETMHRATSIQAQKEVQTDIEYNYSFTPPAPRNILTDVFNGEAVGGAERAREWIARPDVMGDIYDLANDLLTDFERSTLETDHDYIQAIYIKAYDMNGNLESEFEGLPAKPATDLEIVGALYGMIENTYELQALENEKREVNSRLDAAGHTQSMAMM